MTAVVLDSSITCPACGHTKEEKMPVDARVWFYECEHCKTVLRPKSGDCCVYCSYGTNSCPTMQRGLAPAALPDPGAFRDVPVFERNQLAL